VVIAHLPRRDDEARARLHEVARGAAPVVLARDRAVPLPGALGELVPGGTVARGSVLRVTGRPGAGATTLGFELAAAVTALGEWAATRTPYQAAHLLQRAGLAAAPVQDASDLARDPQLRARGFIVEIDHPRIGRMKSLGIPVKSTGELLEIRNPAPWLGQHTAEVLSGVGYASSEIDRLYTEGVLYDRYRDLYLRTADDMHALAELGVS